ncbi:MAG: Aldehyde ferredoxin oxidoreductase, partial [Chloroflexi bacterium]|nr:Aldehyde ferredoxin oxidoreductase [Chloroflexota bacterium]
MYKGGYTGKILRIDLTNAASSVEKVSLELARKYLGGVGFAFKYLYDELRPGTPPLSQENKLILALGTIAAAFSGGHLPDELKRAGFDMLIVEGKAAKPTYISIADGEVRFRSAVKLSGMQTTDTQLFIKDELKDHNYRVACIGPAGENLVPMACIINERRAAGRKGLGAVMGSKNLKAIAVRGTGKPAIVDPTAFQEARKSMLKAMKESHILY